MSATNSLSVFRSFHRVVWISFHPISIGADKSFFIQICRGRNKHLLIFLFNFTAKCMKNGDVTLKYYSIAVKKWKKRIFKQSLLCDRNFSQQQCLAKMCQQLETFLSKNYHCLMNRPCKFAKSQTDALRGKLPLATPFRIIDIMIVFDGKLPCAMWQIKMFPKDRGNGSGWVKQDK